MKSIPRVIFNMGCSSVEIGAQARYWNSILQLAGAYVLFFDTVTVAAAGPNSLILFLYRSPVNTRTLMKLLGIPVSTFLVAWIVTLTSFDTIELLNAVILELLGGHFHNQSDQEALQ